MAICPHGWKSQKAWLLSCVFRFASDTNHGPRQVLALSKWDSLILPWFFQVRNSQSLDRVFLNAFSPHIPALFSTQMNTLWSFLLFPVLPGRHKDALWLGQNFFSLCTIVGYYVCFWQKKEFGKNHNTEFDFWAKNRICIGEKFKRPKTVRGNIISSLPRSSHTWTLWWHCYSRGSKMPLRVFRNGGDLRHVVLAAANHRRWHPSFMGFMQLFCLWWACDFEYGLSPLWPWVPYR